MQAKRVRKTGAVFFGGREIMRGNLTRAALLNVKQAALLQIMLRVLVFILKHALHAYSHW